jgi:hypothetical protein
MLPAFRAVAKASQSRGSDYICAGAAAGGEPSALNDDRKVDPGTKQAWACSKIDMNVKAPSDTNE